ncbi:MAG: hypothetical protein H0Z33_14600 [Bacillaceae bacterium]|nr:hypothetical protein [Bacillaceae bacterium]
MSMIQKVIITLLTLALIVMIPATLMTESINRTALKPYTTTGYIEQTDLSSQVERWVEAALREQTERIQINGVPQAVNQVAQDAIATVIEQQITEELIADKLDLFQIAVWDYITDKTDRVEPIPVPELRESFMTTVKQQLNQWSQQTDIPLSTLGTESERQQMIENMALSIPGAIDLTPALERFPIAMETLKLEYQEQQLNRYILYAGTLIFLLLGILLLRKLRPILTWTGTVLVIGGVFSFVPAIATLALHRELMDLLVPFLGIDRWAGWSQVEQGVLRFVQVIAADFRSHLIVLSAVTLGVGVLMFIISRLIPAARHPVEADLDK